MAGLQFTILCVLTAICLGSVLSTITTWEKAMTTCQLNDQLPSSEEDATKNGSWVGKVKYSFPWGTGTLQIQRVGKNETCSDCDAQTKQCKFCNNRIQLNRSVGSFEVFRTLKPGRKYLLAEFKRETIYGIPPPTQCMVHRGPSHNKYVNCNEKFDDGCKDSGEISDYYITISFNEYGITPQEKPDAGKGPRARVLSRSSLPAEHSGHTPNSGYSKRHAG